MEAVCALGAGSEGTGADDAEAQQQAEPFAQSDRLRPRCDK
jgi:hypothetical protein